MTSDFVKQASMKPTEGSIASAKNGLPIPLPQKQIDEQNEQIAIRKQIRGVPAERRNQFLEEQSYNPMRG